MMKINVSEIADKIGYEMGFNFETDPENIGQLIDDCELKGPIIVKGTAVEYRNLFPSGRQYRLQSDMRMRQMSGTVSILTAITTSRRNSHAIRTWQKLKT